MSLNRPRSVVGSSFLSSFLRRLLSLLLSRLREEEEEEDEDEEDEADEDVDPLSDEEEEDSSRRRFAISMSRGWGISQTLRVRGKKRSRFENAHTRVLLGASVFLLVLAKYRDCGRAFLLREMNESARVLDFQSSAV